MALYKKECFQLDCIPFLFYQEPIEVIQNNAPLGNSRYRQGVFKAKNPSKCMNLVVKNAKGELIYGPPKFRSSYELRFMTWADENEMVLIWGVEVCIVDYTSRIAIMEGKNPSRKYYVDFYVEIINSVYFIIVRSTIILTSDNLCVVFRFNANIQNTTTL